VSPRPRTRAISTTPRHLHAESSELDLGDRAGVDVEVSASDWVKLAVGDVETTEQSSPMCSSQPRDLGRRAADLIRTQGHELRGWWSLGLAVQGVPFRGSDALTTGSVFGWKAAIRAGLSRGDNGVTTSTAVLEHAWRSVGRESSEAGTKSPACWPQVEDYTN
jgi:hypothetical protein